MGSRDMDRLSPRHQPMLSSLVVRPSDSDSAIDYESDEPRRDPPPPLSYHSERFSDDPAGYWIRPASISPMHHRNKERRYSPVLDHHPRSRDIGSRREFDRYRDSSPPYSRGREGGRPFGRGPGEPWLGTRQFRGEGMPRNNPNVRPREGDWYCSNPVCGNLNFARRDHCNSCHRPRRGRRGFPPRRVSPGRISPFRGYHAPSPTLYAPPRRLPGHPSDRSPIRPANGFRSPPRLHRDFPVGGPSPPRHDNYPRRDWRYPQDDYHDRRMLVRLSPGGWSQHDRATGSSFSTESKNFGRSPLSPPLPPVPISPSHDRWAQYPRRSRSPVRGGLPSQEHRGVVYPDKVRDDRHAFGRDRLGNVC